MGIFDFVKEAGKKLLGGVAGGSRPAAEARPQANPELAKALVELVGGLGLKVDDLRVTATGGTVVLAGTTPSQAEKEKVVLAVGNVAGVERVDDRLRVEKPEPEAVFYTVKSGDTLGKIAQQHYGKAGLYPVIFEANKPMLSDPDKIYPGQVLRIPPREG